MSSTKTVDLERLVCPEYVTYRQAGDMLGVSHATVRLLVARGRGLRKKGNTARTPAFPSPYRVSGLPGAGVFLRSEVDAFISERDILSRRLFDSLPEPTDRA